MSNIVFCRSCGREISESDSTCLKCGAQQAVSQSEGVKSNYIWSWWSPLLGTEYASRGMIGMGVLMAFINCTPITVIISSLVLKKRAIKDLSSKEFKWNISAIAVLVLEIFIWLTVIGIAKK